jgi:hypothetical protein
VNSNRTTASGVPSAALGSRFAGSYKDWLSLGKHPVKLVDELRSIPTYLSLESSSGGASRTAAGVTLKF